MAFRTDGLDSPFSPNSGIGCNWSDVEARCEEEGAVDSWRRDASGIHIVWCDGNEDTYTDPQAAIIAIRDMSAC
jgi:hypothetical protein